MKVYIFGNPDSPLDDQAIKVAEYLKKEFADIILEYISPNEDLPFSDEPLVIIVDTVQGLNKPVLLTEADIDKLIVSKSITAHDFDLGFQLKYLKKLGRLNRFFIVGIPQTAQIDYFSIQSIFRKLVAQDMQGS